MEHVGQIILQSRVRLLRPSSNGFRCKQDRNAIEIYSYHSYEGSKRQQDAHIFCGERNGPRFPESRSSPGDHEDASQHQRDDEGILFRTSAMPLNFCLIHSSLFSGQSARWPKREVVIGNVTYGITPLRYVLRNHGSPSIDRRSRNTIARVGGILLRNGYDFATSTEETRCQYGHAIKEASDAVYMFTVQDETEGRI